MSVDLTEEEAEVLAKKISEAIMSNNKSLAIGIGHNDLNIKRGFNHGLKTACKAAQQEIRKHIYD